MADAAPTRLADSWDNVGLIAQAPVPRGAPGVFLAVDLTPAVAEELLARDDISTAIIYHPVIFAPTRAITLANPLQASVLRCIAAGIHIYCPHTTLDACPKGINDWLMVGLAHAWEKDTPADGTLYAAVQAHSFPIALPNKDDASVGVGRYGRLEQPCTWATLLQRIKALLRIDHGAYTRKHCLTRSPGGASGAHHRRHDGRFARRVRRLRRLGAPQVHRC